MAEPTSDFARGILDGVFNKAMDQARYRSTHAHMDELPTHTDTDEPSLHVDMDEPLEGESYPVVAVNEGGDEQLPALIADARAEVIKAIDPSDVTKAAMAAVSVFDKVENKDAVVEGLTNIFADMRDEFGNKIFNSRDKARSFLRLLAYPNTRNTYNVPKSFFRSFSKIQSTKFSPLMKRTLKSLSRF